MEKFGNFGENGVNERKFLWEKNGKNLDLGKIWDWILKKFGNFWEFSDWDLRKFGEFEAKSGKKSGKILGKI